MSLVWEKKWYRKASDEEKAKIRDQVEARQGELLDAVEGGSGVLSAYLRRSIELPDDEFSAPPLPRTLTAPEVQAPPLELEQEIGRDWRQLPASHAAQPLFWLRCFTDWLANNQIQGDLVGGLTMGQRADRKNLGDRDRHEAQTRNFLRRLMGIPVIRFNVSVLSDCTLSRAYWRCRLAAQSEDRVYGNVVAEDAHRMFHSSNRAWEALVMLAVRSLTVINEPTAMAAIVERLLAADDFTEEQVKSAAHAVGQYSHRHSVHHTERDTLRVVLGDSLLPA
jgi:hypothetical protein